MTNPSQRVLPIAFTASGSEYLRIWIVNSLLVVVTLGFYLPFAKARRLRYFYANTVIDGHPLSFHGDAWKLLRGYVLMLLLFGAYALAGHFSASAALVMFLLLALLWPALWRSSLRFRLHNTSWRGLRFGFDGMTSVAYLAVLPLFVPSLVFLAANTWFFDGIDRADTQAVRVANRAVLPFILGAMALLAALCPLSFWLLKGYQHDGYHCAGQRTRFKAPLRSFYTLALKGTGWAALGLALLVAAVVGTLYAHGALGKGAGRDSAQLAAVVLTTGGALAYVGLLFAVAAYLSARGQNLVWNATRSAGLVFESRLRARDLVGLSLKNFALTAVTLGLYRPFAVVNTVALRLSAVQLIAGGDLAQWQARPAPGAESGQGEMAGDFFGIDVGL